mgnify:CR=1 FL=1
MLLAKKLPGDAAFLYAPDGAVPDSYAHPFRVVRFTNKSGGALEKGPIAVFEAGSFLGQGMVDPLPDGATATVPFALERGIVSLDRSITPFEHTTTDNGATVISLSQATILERIRRCADRGILTFQISLPSWGAVSDRELATFFRDVCDGFPECRFVHYNLPRTKRMVTAREYGELASRHPNLVGTKNCTDSMSFVYDLLQESPQLQHFFSEVGYLYGSLFGECGVLASFVTGWQRLHELFDIGKRRDVAQYPELMRELSLYIKLLKECVSAEIHMDGAFDKLFDKVHVPEFPLRLLPPYEGTPDEQHTRLVARLREELPNWMPPA